MVEPIRGGKAIGKSRLSGRGLSPTGGGTGPQPNARPRKGGRVVRPASVRRTGRPLCHSIPAPAGTVWQDRYRHARREDFNGFRNCGKLNALAEGDGKMGRYQRFVESGFANILLSTLFSVGVLLCFLEGHIHLTIRFPSDSGLRMIWEVVLGLATLSAPFAFLANIGITCAIVFEPPYFKRSKTVMWRVGFAIVIQALTIASIAAVIVWKTI